MARYVGIDPSTKTGLVVLDEDGEVWEAKEIEASGRDPERMSNLIFEVAEHLTDYDHVAIEGFGFASQTGFLLGGIGWGIRLRMYERGMRYTEIAPAALKKFTGCKGNAKKDELGVEIYKRWGFEHKSDNVRDAYVLAQIARTLYGPFEIQLIKPQLEVIQVIKNPPTKNAKSKKRKEA
jgi:crossover junction endodeoxyribonuclease RuvC